MLTQSQQYAKRTYEALNKRNLSTEQKNRYGSLAHKLPVLVLQDGLLQALVFMQVKGKTEGEALLEDLASVLGEKKEAMFNKARSGTMLDYMYLTRQVLDASLWFKRFAESILEVSQGQES